MNTPPDFYLILSVYGLAIAAIIGFVVWDHVSWERFMKENKS